MQPTLSAPAAAYPWRGGKGARWYVLSGIQNGWRPTPTQRYRGHVRYKFWDRGDRLFFCALVRRRMRLRMRKVRRAWRRGGGTSSIHWRSYVIWSRQTKVSQCVAPEWDPTYRPTGEHGDSRRCPDKLRPCNACRLPLSASQWA